jgi:hypothetical protein
VALRTHLDGAEVRRSYSICRPPERGAISVGIKRDPGGRFSTWAQTELRPGDELDVMSPQGTFISARSETRTGHVVGVAAGSGITPIMALAASVLAASDVSRFTLVYTNRSSTDVMFADELADLKDRYPTRFVLHHVLSREQRAAPCCRGGSMRRGCGSSSTRSSVPRRSTSGSCAVRSSSCSSAETCSHRSECRRPTCGSSSSRRPGRGGLGGHGGFGADGPSRCAPTSPCARSTSLDGTSARVESPSARTSRS